MAGRILPLESRPTPPAAHEHRAAGGTSAWLYRRLRDLTVIGVVGTVATGLFLAAMGLLALIVGAAQAQTPSSPPVSAVTVHAPPRIGGKAPTASCGPGQAGHASRPEDCAAQQLDQAAQLAQQRAEGAAALGVPAVNAPPTQLGITTPGAVNQQFGPNFGKSVTPYRPPPPVYAPPLSAPRAK